MEGKKHWFKNKNEKFQTQNQFFSKIKQTLWTSKIWRWKHKLKKKITTKLSQPIEQLPIWRSNHIQKQNKTKLRKWNPFDKSRKRGIWESEKQKANLKDPLVHDNHGDIEPPPLKDGKQRSKRAPLAKKTLLHLFLSAPKRQPKNRRSNTTHQRSTTPHFNSSVPNDSERLKRERREENRK